MVGPTQQPPYDVIDDDTAGSAPEAKTPDAADAAAVTADSPPDIEALKADLAATKLELAKVKEDYLRALAETENVRRRAVRDREEAAKYAIANFARDLLSVADNLRRALEAVSAEARANDPALETLTGGVEMTERELLTVFERYGVRLMQPEGRPFDPHLHEAMFELPDEQVPTGTVLQVLQSGYTLHDRTLRPARVGVSRGGPKPPHARQEAVEGEIAHDIAPEAAEEAEVNGAPRPSSSAYERSRDQTEPGSGGRLNETT